MAAHPYHGLPLAHTTISSKHGEPDAEEPNPGSRSTLADYREEGMNTQSEDKVKPRQLTKIEGVPCLLYVGWNDTCHCCLSGGGH